MPRHIPTLIASGSALLILAACCDCTESVPHSKHPIAHRTSANSKTIAAEKPEVISPKSHKACVEDFNFKPGTPQYTKCIASLSQIEE